MLKNNESVSRRESSTRTSAKATKSVLANVVTTAVNRGFSSKSAVFSSFLEENSISASPSLPIIPTKAEKLWQYLQLLAKDSPETFSLTHKDLLNLYFSGEQKQSYDKNKTMFLQAYFFTPMAYIASSRYFPYCFQFLNFSSAIKFKRLY